MISIPTDHDKTIIPTYFFLGLLVDLGNNLGPPKAYL
jgi:hypothetical protein